MNTARVGLDVGSPVPSDAEVVVLGAGLAGLSCAKHLEAQGVHVHVLEASDGVGGRIRTDEKEGFLLDRGFQVMLTAYEELKTQGVLRSLDPRPFKAGSVVWNGDGLQTISDPFRNPGDALASMRAKVGTFADKLKVAELRARLLSAPSDDCFVGDDRSTLEELQGIGFTPEFIDAFFRPFLGGVFLERHLETSAKLFKYYFRCFGAGEAAVPAGGMQRLPELLAEPLAKHISLGSRVTSVTPHAVRLSEGTEVKAGRVVVAVDGLAAARLVGQPKPSYKTTITTYYSTPTPPIEEAVLVLDGVGEGPANHVAVMSNVAPSYAPDGAHLVSVSGVGEAAQDASAFESGALDQMREWFGGTVNSWHRLATYQIPEALPQHPAGSLNPAGHPTSRKDGVIVAGDYTAFGSIQGALLSGRRAAEAILSGE